MRRTLLLAAWLVPACTQGAVEFLLLGGQMDQAFDIAQVRHLIALQVRRHAYTQHDVPDQAIQSQ